MANARQSTQCEHCGTPFQPHANDRFCCHGCEYVFNLLHDEGFARYYELKSGLTTPPVGTRAFANVDTHWLAQAVQLAEAQADGPSAIATFGLRGISCVACVWLVEAVFKAQPGALSIDINAPTGIVQPRWRKEAFDAALFAREIHKLGYELTPATETKRQRPASQDLAQRIGVCSFFLLNTMLFTLPGYLGMKGDYFLAPLFQLLGALFATLSLVVGGSYFFKRAAQALRHKVLSIDFPIALGLSAAYLGSLIGWLVGVAQLMYFDFVATFVFLMLVGRWVQEFALEKSRHQVSREHAESQYVTAYGGQRDGERIPVEQVQTGDAYALAPGEINPVNARLQANASLSLEWINGEPEPLAWESGKTAPAGAINVGLQSVALNAEESWADSLLAKLLAPPPDKRYERRLQRVLTLYIGVVLLIAFGGGLGWLATGAAATTALQVVISVLIVSCPCALGVALPLVDELCHAKLRGRGLFIKSADIWERLRNVHTVVFDKTGTLTLDMPKLLNPDVLGELSATAALALNHMTQNNLHPIARSIRESLLLLYPKLQGLTQSDSVREEVGCGVYLQSNIGEQWSLGKHGWLPGQTAPYTQQIASTELRCDGELVAAFHFAEDVRDDARQTITLLQQSGRSVAILSGDVSDNVLRIADQLRVKQVRAQCTPDEKAEWIAQFAPEGAMMIGDGANDRLAFNHAVCRGAPIVDRSLLDASADFFFFGRSLSSLPRLFHVGRQRQQALNSVFALAITYNFAAVTLCLMGTMHPLLAAILMPLSSIITLAAPWQFLRE